MDLPRVVGLDEVVAHLVMQQPTWKVEDLWTSWRIDGDVSVEPLPGGRWAVTRGHRRVLIHVDETADAATQARVIGTAITSIDRGEGFEQRQLPNAAPLSGAA